MLCSHFLSNFDMICANTFRMIGCPLGVRSICLAFLAKRRLRSIRSFFERSFLSSSRCNSACLRASNSSRCFANGSGLRCFLSFSATPWGRAFCRPPAGGQCWRPVVPSSLASCCSPLLPSSDFVSLCSGMDCDDSPSFFSLFSSVGSGSLRAFCFAVNCQASHNSIKINSARYVFAKVACCARNRAIQGSYGASMSQMYRCARPGQLL